jgi:hypothetical protein
VNRRSAGSKAGGKGEALRGLQADTLAAHAGAFEHELLDEARTQVAK